MESGKEDQRTRTCSYQLAISFAVELNVAVAEWVFGVILFPATMFPNQELSKIADLKCPSDVGNDHIIPQTETFPVLSEMSCYTKIQLMEAIYAIAVDRNALCIEEMLQDTD